MPPIRKLTSVNIKDYHYDPTASSSKHKHHKDKGKSSDKKKSSHHPPTSSGGSGSSTSKSKGKGKETSVEEKRYYCEKCGEGFSHLHKFKYVEFPIPKEI